MLTEKITEDEIEFLETWFTPRALAESLFHKFDNLGSFDEHKFGDIRLYQQPSLSHGSLIDYEATAKHHNLNENEKFKLKKNVEEIFNFGGRLYGKSMVSLKIDIPLSILYEDDLWAGFYSIDEKRMRGILDSVERACKHHPILREWKVHCKYRPDINFFSPLNNWKLQGVNMTLKGKAPGEQFYQLHVSKLWGDEVSFETEQVYKARKESGSEVGMILRLCGMTNFTRHSPAGRAFYNQKNQAQIINLPQFVNPYWDEEKKKEKVEEYGGEDDLDYRIFVKGEIIEDGVSEFDMERVESTINRKKEVKHIELPKKNYNRYKNILIVDRPKNAHRLVLASDIGDKVTDIAIYSQVNDKYNYLYNISLYNLKFDEQVEVFKYLINLLKLDKVGLDCGDGMGRAIYRVLEKLYGKDLLVEYRGTFKIPVDFLYNDKQEVIMKKGVPQYEEEYMSEWSVRRLKVLLYESILNLPTDYKLEKQLSSLISINTGTRRVYKCPGTPEHLLDAFKVFAIMEWLTNSFLKTQPKTDWGLGV